jgi:hypothetical protein
MKITKRTVTEEQIEVSFPHYSTDNICHWYKVISENQMVKIFSDSYSEYCSIDLTQYCIFNAFDKRCTILTEKEFNEKFYEVCTIITNNL